jgi:hypothetical protein
VFAVELGLGGSPLKCDGPGGGLEIFRNFSEVVVFGLQRQFIERGAVGIFIESPAVSQHPVHLPAQAEGDLRFGLILLQSRSFQPLQRLGDVFRLWRGKLLLDGGEQIGKEVVGHGKKVGSIGDCDQSGDAFEFVLIVGDDTHPVGQGGGGDPQIVGSDESAFGGEETADFSVLP